MKILDKCILCDRVWVRKTGGEITIEEVSEKDYVNLFNCCECIGEDNYIPPAND